MTFNFILDKSLGADLRAFGLDNFDTKLITSADDHELDQYASEIRLSDIRVDVHKLENHNKKLTEDIEKSQKSIKALKE